MSGIGILLMAGFRAFHLFKDQDVALFEIKFRCGELSALSAHNLLRLLHLSFFLLLRLFLCRVVLRRTRRFTGLLVFRLPNLPYRVAVVVPRQAAFLISPGVEGDPVMIFPKLMFSSPIGSKTSYWLAWT